LVEHATSERGQHPAFRGDYESIVTAANSPRTKDWNEEARLSLYRLYSELYDSSVPQNDFGFVYTENAPESLHQNGWTHIKDFATARVPLGTRVKTGAAASATALVAIVAPEAIAVTGIYGQAALWTGLGFAAVKETAVASIEGPATRAREIRDEITRPWRENDPVGAALQFGGLAGFGLSFSPAVQSVTRPLMQRAAGAIEAKVTSALGNFGQMGEGSEVMAASGQMAGSVAQWDRVTANISRSTQANRASNFAVYAAREEQAIAGYAPDTWEMATLRKGSLVYGGTPGQSAFYTDFPTVRTSRLDANNLFGSLQVRPHPAYGFRSSLRAYRVLEDIRVPRGLALNNPMLGSGGGVQYYVPQFEKTLLPVRDFELKR
jgi:hypothetical protein